MSPRFDKGPQIFAVRLRTGPTLTLHEGEAGVDLSDGGQMLTNSRHGSPTASLQGV